MIAEADQALAVVVKSRVIGNAAISVAFDQPSRPWIQGLDGAAAVNLFLFDIKENVLRRDVMYEKVRDAEGVVQARRRPPPRFDLHYTVTAWAPTIFVEHKILAAVLRCFSSMTTLPREVLPAPLAELPYEVLVSTDSGPKRGMLLNLSGELKAGFDLTVTVPIPGLPELPAAPVVQQAKVTIGPVAAAKPQARTATAQETVAVAPAAPGVRDPAAASGAPSPAQ